MMFSLASIKKRLNDQGGFSLAEVVMAIVLFTSAVVGISGLVISGGADIARGASDSAAANLANKKIEEVRSLPFYKSWQGKDQDIDDFYFNRTVDNSQQINNPGEVENYGSIPGASAYRRTTAVQYQVVSESGMTPSEMATNWVPRPKTGEELTSTQIDRPTTVTGVAPGVAIHSLIVEVAVYYRTNGQERVYRQRTLAGDMLIPGGSSVPIIMVKAITPTSGPDTQSNLLMTITIDAQESIRDENFDIRLWASGCPDLVGSGTNVVNQHEITTSFNLTPSGGGRQGMYNISVNWSRKGWVDKDFRNCFQILGPAPTITSIGKYNWGFREQSSRQVTINGANLANPRYVGLVGPNEGGSDPDEYKRTPVDSVSCLGSIVSAANDKIVVNFNLSRVPADSLNTHWTVEVVTWGGTAYSNSSNRMLINPKPQVTSVTPLTGPFYRKASYSNPIKVEGKYFLPGSIPNVTLKKDPLLDPPLCEDIKDNFAAGGVVTEVGTDGTTTFTMTALDLRLEEKDSEGNVIVPRPIKAGNGDNEVGNWNLYVTNQDGLQSAETDKLVSVAHAPLAITNVTSGICYNDWDQPVTITGNYFDTANTTVFMEDNYGITGTISVTGAYGTGQTLGSALVMNTINWTAKAYTITVTDSENSKTATYSYTVAAPAGNAVVILPAGTTAPSDCTWPQQNAFWNDSTITGHDIDTEAEKNICSDNNTYTYKVIAKRMRNSNVRWSFTPNGGSEYAFTVNKTDDPATMVFDRANKYVLAIGKITWANFAPEITDVDAKCSNDGGTTPGVLSPARIRIDKHII